MMPIIWDEINSFLDSNALFDSAIRSMRSYVRNDHQEDERQFLDDFRADLDGVLNTYHFENAGISFSRDFCRELNYISVWIRIEDPDGDYVGTYTLFLDEQLNTIDDQIKC